MRHWPSIEKPGLSCESTLNALPIHAKDHWRVWLPPLACPRAWQCVCSNIIVYFVYEIWLRNVAFFRSNRLAKIFRGCTLREIVRLSIKSRVTATMNRCSPNANLEACQMFELHYPLHKILYCIIYHGCLIWAVIDVHFVLKNLSWNKHLTNYWAGLLRTRLVSLTINLHSIISRKFLSY